MTPPKPVDLEELREKWDALFEVNIQMLNELIHLRTRVKELEDRPIEIDISKDKIIRILTKKLEELTAENERLKNK